MTVPRVLRSASRRVSDMVREMIPRQRSTFTEVENDLALHLRGNAEVFNGLKAVIESRIGVRAHSPVPTNPIDCKAVLERDFELRWLLGRLTLIYNSSGAQPVEEDSEQPA